jgi:hypothetical protein
MPVASTITSNAVLPDGSIQGLNLISGETLTIRNHPTAITVFSGAAAAPGFTLRFLLGSGWTSTIHFDAATNPLLEGTLELNIDQDADPASLVGESFDLFAWNGPVPPDHRCSAIVTDSGFTWDLSDLYTSGSVTLLSAPSLALDAVPEPASLFMLALGALPLLAARRRRYPCALR